MRDDYAARRRFRIDARQRTRDIFVGEPVKTVAPHAAIRNCGRQRERLREFRLRAMKGRIKACDLRHFRRTFGDDPNRRQVVRLVQWREGNELLEVRHNV